MLGLTWDDWRLYWYYPPNLVSFARGLLAIPVCFWLLTEGVYGWIAWWLLLVAVLTDKVDGWLAKRNGGKWTTKLGKVVDPYIDKILTLAVLVTACLRSDSLRATLIVVASLVFAREVNVMYVRARRPVESAGEPGRFSMVAQSIALLWATMPIWLEWHHDTAVALLYVGLGASLASGWGYVADWYRSLFARAKRLFRPTAEPAD